MNNGARTISAYFNGGTISTTATTSLTSSTSTTQIQTSSSAFTATSSTTQSSTTSSSTTSQVPTQQIVFYCRNIADLGKDPATTNGIGSNPQALFGTYNSQTFPIPCSGPLTLTVPQYTSITVWYNFVSSPSGWVPANVFDLYGVQTLRGAPSAGFSTPNGLMKIGIYYQPAPTPTTTTQIQTSQTSTASTTTGGVTVTSSAPNCPYIQPNPPNDRGISGSWASWNPNCLFLPYNQFGGAHFTKHSLTWTVSYVDVDPLHYVPSDSKYTTPWGALLDADVRKQNVQATIQNAFNEWSQAFTLYGKPSYFTFQYVPNLPADIHFYVVRSNDVSPYSFAESYTPYVGAVLLQVQGIQAVNLNEAATHELGHILGLRALLFG